MGFSISDYLKRVDPSDPYPDLGYLFNVSDKDFGQFFSLDTFVKLEQRSSQDYEKHYKYIYSGCSESSGEYLSLSTSQDPFNYKDVAADIWGSIVGSKLGLSEYLNLSVGGASAMGIVTGLLRQIREYGPPDHILILFPNLDSRVTFVKDDEKLVSLSDNQDLVNDISTIGEYEANYSKRPHVVEEIFTKRWATYLNIQNILFLEDICKALNINLIYSTWSTSTHEILSVANALALKRGHPVPFKNYIVSDYKKSAGGCIHAIKLTPNDCHRDKSDHPLWLIGKGNSHMGVHAHIHAADMYINELSARGFLPKL